MRQNGHRGKHIDIYGMKESGEMGNNSKLHAKSNL